MKLDARRAKWMATAAVAALAIGCGGDDPGAVGPSAPTGAGPAPTHTPHTSAPIAGGHKSSGSGGTTRWSARVGGALGDLGHAAAADSTGNVYIAGMFDGTAEVAGVPMTTAGGLDVFVAKFTPAGEAAWVRHFGGAGVDMVSGVTIGADGDVWFSGTSTSELDLGGGKLGPAGGAGVYVGRLDPFGNHLGSAAFGGSSIGAAALVQLDGAGNVVLAGSYQTSMTFGTTVLPDAAGTYDVFVAKFDPTGTVVFAKRVGGTGIDALQGLAIDAMGNVVLAGGFTETADFGTGPLTSAGDYDAFVATIGATGTALHASRFGGVVADLARGVAVDAKGAVVVTGTFGGSVDFGGGAVRSNGNGDAFVTKRDATLAHVWTKTYGGAGEDQAAAIAADTAGNVAVAGFFEGAMQVGATPFMSEGQRDAFLLELDAKGGAVFSKHFGAKEDDEAVGVAFDGFGRVVVTGHFRASVDFGAGSQTSAGETDVFLATFDP